MNQDQDKVYKTMQIELKLAQINLSVRDMLQKQTYLMEWSQMSLQDIDALLGKTLERLRNGQIESGGR